MEEIFTMLPIGPLMIEHRLIERNIEVLKVELKRIRDLNELNPIFIDKSVDFIRVYADQTHHGKEENILFRELLKKSISEEHKKIMNELIEEHKFGRKTTGELVKAKDDYVKGNHNSINIIVDKLKVLIDFYPKHIEKEDKHFFIPVMKYFTKEEQDAMLKEGQEFDRRMIHRKYNKLVHDLEEERGLKGIQKPDWINYI
ncbi:MAG: hemerythrin domain-containing protein [Candidatus Hermodarchaeota archaeon]